MFSAKSRLREREITRIERAAKHVHPPDCPVCAGHPPSTVTSTSLLRLVSRRVQVLVFLLSLSTCCSVLTNFDWLLRLFE